MTKFATSDAAALSLIEMAAAGAAGLEVRAEHNMEVVQEIFKLGVLDGLTALVAALVSQNCQSLHALTTATGIPVSDLLGLRRRLATSEAAVDPDQH